jgi:hypothetical protein
MFLEFFQAFFTSQPLDLKRRDVFGVGGEIFNISENKIYLISVKGYQSSRASLSHIIPSLSFPYESLFGKSKLTRQKVWE